jgi:hypothetical protein
MSNSRAVCAALSALQRPDEIDAPPAAATGTFPNHSSWGGCGRGRRLCKNTFRISLSASDVLRRLVVSPGRHEIRPRKRICFPLSDDGAH